MAGLEILKGLEISTASRSFGAVTSALEERKKKNHPPLPCKSVLIDQSTNLVFFETIDNFAFNVAWERFMTETVLTV